MPIVIRIENLSKAYRLGVIGSGTLRDDLQRWWAGLRGQENPHLKIGAADCGNRDGDTVWALREVNLEVQEGEILGIIGKNGAGKSTLLKILSRVTGPTTGMIKYNGRIGALLEVGTGFHPELTGQENIFLNGAILGMTRAEIKANLDEIIDFSGCERYINTPVKRYSSGMKVRLAFAVAAHLEPEILIIDEVLAVGDAEFQKKCLGKMRDVAGHGRTVLFVSHNMASMKQLCQRGILLENGRIKADGEIESIVHQYLSLSHHASKDFHFSDGQHRTKSALQIESLHLELPQERAVYLLGEQVSFLLGIRCEQAVQGARIGIGLVSEGLRVCTLHSEPMDFSASDTTHLLRCTIPGSVLLPGNFYIVLGAHLAKNGQGLDYINAEIPFEISKISNDAESFDTKSLGLVQVQAEWRIVPDKG